MLLYKDGRPSQTRAQNCIELPSVNSHMCVQMGSANNLFVQIFLPTIFMACILYILHNDDGRHIFYNQLTCLGWQTLFKSYNGDISSALNYCINKIRDIFLENIWHISKARKLSWLRSKDKANMRDWNNLRPPMHCILLRKNGKRAVKR